MASSRWSAWSYIRGLTPPVLILTLVAGWLLYAIYTRIDAWRKADENNLREWLNEARVFRKTLPELVREYLDSDPGKAPEIAEQLRSLGNPTRMYQGQLPLFPDIHRLEVYFPGQTDREPIFWDDGAPHPRGGRVLDYPLLGENDGRAMLRVEYQLHAYDKRQRDEEHRQALTLGVTILAVAAAFLMGLWVWFFLKRERRRELEHLVAQQQIEHTEKLLLENELRSQEAERKQDEMKRTLLEQQLATQAAEQQALELKSQLYAGIGIMAGSYAHNIKNLLVRPNDLLSRCLENDGLSRDQETMLAEVRQTLGTVTERLQQILRTVRRDPTRSEMLRLDLNGVVEELRRTWEELAREKWKLSLTAELTAEPLVIHGDASHLMQAVENLLFNARDATFEMRNHLRDEARQAANLDDAGRRQALIEAAAWKGTILLRTRRRDGQAILEVQDNGIGMTDDVRRRCTETHYSTKRDNAIYEGNSTGMGLGLSFVDVILEHHRATLEIEAAPRQGALFRARFPLAE